MRANFLPMFVALLLSSGWAGAEEEAVSGRFSLFGLWSQRTSNDALSSDFSQLTGTITVESEKASGPFEFAVDARLAVYPSSDRKQRVSLYEAWAGVRFADDKWRLRIGHIWLHELGGLGAVAGLHAEYRQTKPSALGRFRVGVFAGLEPESYELGYVPGVKKAGFYAVLEGGRGRRHTLGWVVLRNESLNERSVVVLNNFLPITEKLSIYQAGQYDVGAPGGLAEPGLSYLFANIRYQPIKLLDLQGSYHRGRSVDARRLTDDQLAGRPVDPRSLDGLLFESARLRISIRPKRGINLWASYGQSRHDRDETRGERLGAGLSAANIFDSGVNVSLAASRNERPGGSYDSFYGSIGMSLGRRTYLTADYTETLAVFQQDSAGGSIQIRPDSRRYSLSANIELDHKVSLIFTLEVLAQETADEIRAVAGIVIRF